MERINRQLRLAAVAWFSLGLSLTGCGGTPVYPLTTGYHAPSETFGQTGDRLGRYVVWSNHTGAGHYLTGLLLRLGHTVVERSRLQQVFDEQQIRLIHTPEDEKNVLRVGRLVGATQVIFAEVSVGMPPGYSTAYQASVALRGVSVESGEVRWSATAHFPDVFTSSPDQGVITLTNWAILRAVCQESHDTTWEEPSSTSAGGCVARRSP